LALEKAKPNRFSKAKNLGYFKKPFLNNAKESIRIKYFHLDWKPINEFKTVQYALKHKQKILEEINV